MAPRYLNELREAQLAVEADSEKWDSSITDTVAVGDVAAVESRHRC